MRSFHVCQVQAGECPDLYGERQLTSLWPPLPDKKINGLKRQTVTSEAAPSDKLIRLCLSVVLEAEGPGTVWCAGIGVIPVMVQIKMLFLRLTDLTQIFSDGGCKCPILDVSI